MKLLHLPAVILFAAGAGCARTPDDGPPTIRLGRDECLECGMTIVEERSAAAMLVEVNRRRDGLLFDDIGCMLDAWDSRPELHVVRAFVHAYDGSGWVEAQRAHFVRADADRLRTPMGSGIGAFTTAEAARAAHGRTAGTLLDLAALRESRRARPHQRSAGPD